MQNLLKLLYKTVDRKKMHRLTDLAPVTFESSVTFTTETIDPINAFSLKVTAVSSTVIDV